MRELKFRAWDGNRMIEPYSVRYGKAHIIKECDRNDRVMTDEHGINYYCNWDIDVPTEFPVMQFTGLHDKNGSEIYEGDILNHETFGYKIKMDLYQWASFLRDIDRMNSPCQYIEVIGNKYENPELIK